MGDYISDYVFRTRARPEDIIAPAPVKYKRTLANAVTPVYSTDGAAGFDLSTAEEVVIQPGNIAMVTTGLVIATPANHMLYITFRSSTPRKYNVTVLEGIVDADYRGDDDVIKLQLWNFGDRPKRIPMQTRLAQGIFIPVTRREFVETNSMGASRGGFGSTG